MLCSSCKYDLAEVQGSFCPNCGKSGGAAQTTTESGKRQRAIAALLAAILLATLPDVSNIYYTFRFWGSEWVSSIILLCHVGFFIGSLGVIAFLFMLHKKSSIAYIIGVVCSLIIIASHVISLLFMFHSHPVWLFINIAIGVICLIYILININNLHK